MKKYLNLSFGYAVAGMAGGVFFREFTKFNNFTGLTMLGNVHVHLIALGTFVFLLVALFNAQLDLEKQKSFGLFMKLYNIGLPLTGALMLVRGVVEVLNIALSPAVSGAISGVAGIGHILTGVGLVLLLKALKNAAKD